ncbi:MULTISPECIES: hypothetical protein [Microbacterium]|uniref:hypothetical protein n=1 Tax=Microbacterium TaxID=33882 RepID=UPI0012B7CBC0|nr:MULTISPECIES: hypothetical protein [Microbacterium]MTE23750.1 hypothetical protein [Microbacterium sp. ZXX196]NHI16962.1 hypothetical protein [Microbacterium excoecariae]
MQLGTRWRAGEQPPASVPAVVREEIEKVEATLPGVGPQPMWTLTWLESRPIAELDSGIEITLGADGRATVSTFDPMD